MADDKTKERGGSFAEAALRALDLGDVAVWDWNLSTGEFNSRGPWERLLGPLPSTSDEGRVAWFLDLVHPDDRGPMLEIAEDASRSGSIDLTFRVIRPDGEVRWIAARGGVTQKQDSADQYLSGVMLDVTERVTEEVSLHDALGRSEQLLRSVVANAPATIQTIDRSGKILTSNQPVVGENVFQWAPGERAVQLQAVLDRVFDKRETAHLDGQVEGVGFLRGSYAPIIEHDEVVAAAVVVFDVTDHRNEQIEIRDSEARFRTMAESSPLSIWRSGRDMGCTYVNSEFLGFSGRPLSQLLGNRWAELLHSDDRTEAFQVWADAFARRAPFSFEAHFRRADGEYRLMLASGRPVVAAEGEFDGYVGTMADITDIRRAEEASEQHRSELANSLRLATMDQMAAGLAHELHQPLASISAATGAALRQLSDGRPDDGRLREMVDEARQQALRAGTLLGHMRDFIRKAPRASQQISINKLVHSSIDLVRREAARRRISLDVRLAQGLPTTIGNHIELQQVLINLAQNAFHAMGDVDEERRVLRIETAASGTEAVQITVRDHGVGFTDEVEREMFNVFFTTRDDGLGMGLAISRSIVESHGGTLSAEAADIGALFRLTLPVRRTSDVGN